MSESETPERPASELASAPLSVDRDESAEQSFGFGSFAASPLNEPSLGLGGAAAAAAAAAADVVRETPAADRVGAAFDAVPITRIAPVLAASFCASVALWIVVRVVL